MIELISRESLLKKYDTEHKGAPGRARQLIEEEPTVEERKTGRWVDIGGVIRYGCPFCHYAQEVHSNFCPNCGADMRGEEHGKNGI